MRRIALLAIATGFLVPLLASAPASAQATRTWVSGVGDDANPCSRTAPCKTFAGAISKTAASGTINCLDSGGFGAVTIGKGLTIRCVGVEGGVLVAAGNGVVVAAASTDNVTLDGLDFEGLSPPNASSNGVLVNSGGKVYINNSRIHQFGQNGVLVNSTASVSHVFINDSIIHNTGVGGVNVTGPNNVASLTNVKILTTGNFSVQANGAGTLVGVETSVLNDSPVGISAINGGQVVSVGPSNLLSGSGAFTSTVLYK
jgi:hypothetical protein